MIIPSSQTTTEWLNKVSKITEVLQVHREVSSGADLLNNISKIT